MVTEPGGHCYTVEDCHRFHSTPSDVDRYLLGEGSDRRIYDKLGAHSMRIAGVAGTRFSVWAPNASRVSVVGSFNDLGRAAARHAPAPRQRHLGDLPAARRAGDRYKFELLDRRGRLLPLKSDPFGRAFEHRRQRRHRPREPPSLAGRGLASGAHDQPRARPPGQHL